MSTSPKKLPIHLQSSQNRLLIKNGRIVNDDCIFDADIFIENGVIAQIGNNLTVPGGVRVIDARASAANEVNYILPGGIDAHTHLQNKFEGQQTVDGYYDGTRAALAGGTTTVINFALTSKQAPSLLEAYELERKLADSQVCCDYALHLVIAEWVEGRTEQEIGKLVNELGVNSFKIFLCYSMKLSDSQIIRVLEACARHGALALAHCENGDIIEHNANKLISQGLTGPEAHLYSRPECVEAEATLRVSTLAEQVGCPLMVVHVMSKSACRVVLEQRLTNSTLFAETLVASIGSGRGGAAYFDRSWRHAAAHVMAPPLNPDESTPGYLLGALASGVLQVLSSDHCVFSSKQKAIGERDFRRIPCGVNGIEERMMVAWEKGVRGGHMDLCKFVAATSTNAAKLYNLYPRKGRIQVGSDADLVIWGRNVRTIQAATHHSKGDFNIFEGQRVESGPLVVIANGKVVLDQSGLHVVQGGGRYLARQPFPVQAYGALRLKRRLGAKVAVDRSPAAAAAVAAAAASAAPGVSADAAGKLAELSLAPAGTKSRPDSGAPEGGSAGAGAEPAAEGFHSRASKSGVKNMQDSTFKFTGEQLDDGQTRSNIRVSGQPPGGRSAGIW